jgi:RHS repeat-associated protein
VPAMLCRSAAVGAALRLRVPAAGRGRGLCAGFAAFLVAMVAVGLVGVAAACASVPTTAIRYVYDADGQLKGLVEPASETAFYSWDPAGNLLSIARASSKKLSVIELTPARGAVGESVTISGTGFSTTKTSDTVKFNGTKATVSAATAVSLTVKVPTGASSGTVSVQTTSEGPVTSSQSFTVASSPAPTITSLSATVASAGSEVTISGANFETNSANDAVLVNRTRPELVSASSTAIGFRVPEATSGGPVSVATPQGSAKGPMLFIAPSGISPATVGATGELTLAGSKKLTVSKSSADVALFAFEATAGEHVSFVTSAEDTIRFSYMKIYGPQGQQIADGDFGFWEKEVKAVGPLTLPTTGMYTIVVEPSEGATGSVKLSGYSVTNVKGSITPTTKGSETSVSLPTPTQQGEYTVSGTAGESVFLKTSNADFTGGSYYVEWLNAEGSTIASQSFGDSDGYVRQVKFPTTGTYTLVVRAEGPYTGSVTVTAYEADDVTGTITPTAEGQAKVVTTTVPGQYARISFEGKEGERVSLVASEATDNGGEVSVWGPEGSQTTTRQSYSSNAKGRGLVALVTLPKTGTYTILVEPQGEGFGNVTLTAYAISEATGTITPSAAGESETFTTSVPGQHARIGFEGKEGERVSLVVSEATYAGGSISILGPSGSEVAGGSLGFEEGQARLDGPVTLPATGTYTIVVEPESLDTGNVTIDAYIATEVKGSITPTTEGASTEVTLASPGQKASYTVEGVAGESVSLKTSHASLTKCCGTASWYSPEGEYLGTTGFDATGGSFIKQVRFAKTGTYTLVVAAEGVSYGTVTLAAYLADDVTGTLTPTSEGESKKVTLSVPGQFARISLPATAEHKITVKAAESTIANGRMSILNPEGTRIVNELNFSGSGVTYEFTPSTTGTYTILLEPQEEDLGSIELTAYLGSHPAVVRAMRLGASATTHTPLASDGPSGLDGLGPVAFALVASPTGQSAGDVAGAGPRASQTARSGGRRGRRALQARRRGRLAVHKAAGEQREPEPITPEMRSFRPVPSAGARRPTAGGSQTPWTKVVQRQGGWGQTALSGQVLAQDGLPVPGVRLAIQGTDLATQTDEAGRFLLAGAPAGHRVLVVEGESPSSGTRYGAYEIAVDIAPRRTTILPYTIWLTPLDPAGDRHVASPTTGETRLTTPQIPGLEVRIPAGSVITDRSGHIVHDLNVTAIPVERAPFPLPPFVSVPLYFTVQPGGAWLSKGAQIVYPNWGHLPPGQHVDFWNYDPHRGWYVYGKGTVTPDGKQVMPDASTRIWEFSGAMWQNTPEPPERGPKPGAETTDGDPVDLGTGLFTYHKTDLVLPDVIPIKIEHTYREEDANSYSFGEGTASLYDIRLWSDELYKEVDLVLPDGGTVRYERTSPGEGYKNAELRSSDAFGIYRDSTIKWDESEPGWDLTLTNGMTYIFGELAPLQAIRDRNGNELTITREDGQRGNITQITSPHGLWVKFTYNKSSDVTEIKNNAGQTLQYTYESEEGSTEQLATATDAAGRTTTYHYNEASTPELTEVKDGRGKTYVKTEYLEGRVKKQTLANEGTYTFVYEVPPGGGSGGAVGRARFSPEAHDQILTTTVTDPRNIKREVHFNGEELATSEINALGTSLEQTTTYQDGTPLPLSVTDPLGRKTSYEYDAAGNVTQETLLAGTPSARTLKYTYEPNTSELTSFTNALGEKWTYHYGEHGELLSETDPLDHKTSYEYNSEGQPTSIENALGKKTKLSYEFGYLTSVTDPLGRTTRQFVNALGRVTSATSPQGQRVVYERDADNQITKVTDPLGAETSYEYDSDGNLTATTDADKHKTSYGYGPMDLPGSETDPLEHTAKSVYDQDGDLVEQTNRDGKLSKFTYDALGRLSEARYGVSGESAESTIKYEYDSGSRLTKIIDSASGTYTPEYDGFDRLKSLATPNGTISYEYNEADERTSMKVAGQEPVKYSYDEAGRLTEIKRGSETVIRHYDEANLPTSVTLPDGIEETYGYDEDDELTSIAYTKGKTKLGEIDYAYNAEGLREAVWGSYARTGLPEAISSAAYNADDEQTERNGRKLSYDAEGNLTSDGSSEYKWNARGQLAEITGAIKAAFAYDPFGRRVSKTLSGTTTKLLYDGPNVVQETQGSSTANLLTGLAPSSTFARTTSKGSESLLTDALGSTIALGGSSGKAETSYTYDPFGATTKEGVASENPFQYTGQENDGNGLYDYRARYYDPAAAGFVSQDPLGEEGSGPNLYRYADGSPTNAADPYGTSSILDELGEGIAGWGDAATGGLTRLIREELGINNINSCSTAYQAGSDTGVATAVVLPGDEQAAAADLAEDTADEADETVGVVRQYTGDDGARGIERDGLIRPSEDGNVYLTTDIYSNGADAQAGLNLSQTPTGYFEIPLDRIPNAQGPFPVDGGTGTEILNPGGVDATGLTFNPF